MKKKLTAKKKYAIFKIAGLGLDFIVLFGLTGLGVLFGFDKLWGNTETEDIKTFTQWITLISYRLGIYLLPGTILSFFVFDKRFKYLSRLRIWLNWTLCLYLIANAIVRVFAINKLYPKLSIFNNIDAAVMLIGYVLTFVTKEKVEFDSTGAIIDPKTK